MICYRYTTERNPPAPFVRVSVRCSLTREVIDSCNAQIDTAADRTVLPLRIVQALNLPERGVFQFQGFGSEVLNVPYYLVEVSIHDFPPVQIMAILGEREPYILLGRDVLNSHRLLLDGPNLAFEIERPSEPEPPLIPESGPTSPGDTPPSAPPSSS